MNDKNELIREVCNALSLDAVGTASAILRTEYPFSVHENAGRNFSKTQSISIFVRDGFIDRYSGKRLVFPGVLRLLSFVLPKEFPFHPNWKTDACHFAYYELQPTIDHEVPVTRGGNDDEGNWITTSALRNMAKSNFLLDEIGWIKHPAGNFAEWDGLMGWFLEYVRSRPELVRVKYVQEWTIAARVAIEAAA